MKRVRQWARGAWDEGGGMAAMMVVSIGVVGMLLLSALTVGVLAIHRQQTQNAADAVAVADAWDLLQNPVPVGGGVPVRGWALADPGPNVIFSNTAHGPSASRQVGGDCILAWADAGATDDSVVGVGQIFKGQSLGFRMDARATVFQNCFAQSLPIPPRFMLVLDYSASMRLRFCPSFDPNDSGSWCPPQSSDPESAEMTLKAAVETVLKDSDLDAVRIGAVLFREGVVDEVAPSDFGTGARQSLINAVANENTHCASGSGCPGNHSVAIQKAREYLVNDAAGEPPCLQKFGKYMLMVSDGAPEAPISKSQAISLAEGEAAAAKSEDNIVIASIGILRQNSGPEHALFLENIASDDCQIDPSNCSHDKSGFFVMVNSSDAFFDAIAKQTQDILCTHDEPLDPQVPFTCEGGEQCRELWPVYAFLANATSEIAVQRANTIDDLYTTDPANPPQNFFYDAEIGCVVFSQAICERLEDSGEQIRIRFGLPRLVP